MRLYKPGTALSRRRRAQLAAGACFFGRSGAECRAVGAPIAGRLRIGTILFLAALCAAGYTGFQLLPIWIRYYEFQAYLDERAHTAQLSTPDRIREALLDHAAEVGIPLDTEGVEIDRQPNRIAISAYWEEEVVLLGLYPIALPFTAEAARRLE